MKKNNLILRYLILGTLLLTQALPINRPVRASGVIGDGSPGSCTADAFTAALAGGGEVTFNCGPYYTLIELNGTQTISQDTSIDTNGALIVLRSLEGRIFTVEAGVTLSLKNIRLGGSITDKDGGTIYNQGTLHIENSVFHNSYANGEASRGGAIFNTGFAHLSNTLIYDAHAGSEGGAIYNTGTLEFSGIILRNNIANANGGALYNTGSLSGTAAWFDANQVLIIDEIGRGGGGGIYNSGTLNLTAASFTSNIAGAGGGLFNLNSATLSDAAFRNNQAKASNKNSGGGGGIANKTGAILSLTDSSFNGNQALTGRGGGLLNESQATLNAITFSTNTAELGGGMYNNNAQAITLTNITFSENIAYGLAGKGGGLYNGSPLTLIHATFSSNTAPAQAGSAIYHNTIISGNNLYLQNTIITGSSSGDNCAENIISRGHIISNGNNLSDDDTCKLTQTTDLIEANVMLYPLGFYGGKTFTHLPIADSPAIDKGACQVSVTIDQRGISRPQGSSCDIGAVEARSAEPLLNWLYIPLVFRQQQ